MPAKFTAPKLTAAQLSANLVSAIHENSHNHPHTMAEALASREAFGEYVSRCADAYNEGEPDSYPSDLGRNTANKLYRRLLAEFQEVHPRVMLEVGLINARAAHTAAYTAHAKAVLNLNLHDGEDAHTLLAHPQPARIKGAWLGAPQVKAPTVYAHSVQAYGGTN